MVPTEVSPDNTLGTGTCKCGHPNAMSSDNQTPVLHNTSNVCSMKARSHIIAEKCLQVSNEEDP